MPLIKTTTNSNTILQQRPTEFFYFYWNSTLQVSPKVKKVLQLLRLRQQWRVHQAQKGYHQHAPHLWWVVRHCPRRSGWCFSAWSQSWHWTAMLIKGVLTLIQSWALNWSWSFLLRADSEAPWLKHAVLKWGFHLCGWLVSRPIAWGGACVAGSSWKPATPRLTTCWQWMKILLRLVMKLLYH